MFRLVWHISNVVMIFTVE